MKGLKELIRALYEIRNAIRENCSNNTDVNNNNLNSNNYYFPYIFTQPVGFFNGSNGYIEFDKTKTAEENLSLINDLTGGFLIYDVEPNLHDFKKIEHKEDESNGNITDQILFITGSQDYFDEIFQVDDKYMICKANERLQTLIIEHD